MTTMYVDYKAVLANRILAYRDQAETDPKRWLLTCIYHALIGQPLTGTARENACQAVADLWLDALHADNRRCPSSAGMRFLRVTAAQTVASIGQNPTSLFAIDSLERDLAALLKPPQIQGAF